MGCAGLDTRKGGGGGIPQGGVVAEGPVGGGGLVRGERTRSSRKTILNRKGGTGKETR